MSVTDLLHHTTVSADPRDHAGAVVGARSFSALLTLSGSAGAVVLGTPPIEPGASDYDDDEDEDYFYDDDDEDEDDLDDDFDEEEDEPDGDEDDEDDEI